jgi:uncharacterized membrane protein
LSTAGRSAAKLILEFIANKMNSNEEQQIKKEFQLERVILFSDAVYAIIMTIMVIDIKLPEGLDEANIKQIQHEFFLILLKLIAYAASFFLVANFWIRHLKIFSFLKDCNVPLMALNLLFLFSVSLFPFAISLVTGATRIKSFSLGLGVNIYIGIIFSSIFSQTLLTGYLIRHKKELCVDNSEIGHTLKWKAQRLNLYIIPALAAVVIIFNYFGLAPVYSLYVAAFLGMINGGLRRIYYPNR